MDESCSNAWKCEAHMKFWSEVQKSRCKFRHLCQTGGGGMLLHFNLKCFKYMTVWNLLALLRIKTIGGFLSSRLSATYSQTEFCCEA